MLSGARPAPYEYDGSTRSRPKQAGAARAPRLTARSYWAFLEVGALRWDRVLLEQIGEFTAWLRRPADNVIVLASGTPQRGHGIARSDRRGRVGRLREERRLPRTLT